MLIEYIVAAVGAALVFIGWNVMVNMDKMNAALASMADSQVLQAEGLEEVAAAIRNPQVDNNSQEAVDTAAGKVEAAAAAMRATAESLKGLAAEETALDAGEAAAGTTEQ